MSIRTDFTIDWGASPRIITVTAPSVEVTIQDLYDTCRSMEAESSAMDDASIIEAAGKEELGGGTSVGLTATLQNALLAFEVRLGPEYTQCSVSGGNLVAINGVGTYFTTPIYPTAFTQVVVTASSSATIQEQDAILYSSYQNAIWVDPINGDDNNLGNREYPVKTTSAATTIGREKGFAILQVLNDIIIGAGDDIRNFRIIGVSHIITNVTIEDAALCERLVINDCTFNGVLDGDTEVFNCVIGDVDYVNGHIHNCGLNGKLTIGGTKKAMIENCRTIDQDNPPEIDMGGSGQSLAMPNYSGILTVGNLNDVNEEIGVGLDAGMVVILPTVSAGTVIIGGNGLIDDQSTGTAIVNVDGLMNKTLIGTAVWDDISHNHIADSHGAMLHRLKYLKREVYINTELATTGNEDGSQDSPFNVQADAMDYAEDNSIRTLVVSGDIELERNLKNFDIRCLGRPTIDCAGFDLTGTKFLEAKLEGVYVGRIEAYNCILLPGLYLNGGFNGCGAMSSLSVVDGGSAVLKGCFNVQASLSHTNISMNSGGASNLSLEDCSGRWIISDCDNISDILSATINGGHLIFDATCTAGNMVALGNCDFDDFATAAGAMVINRTLSPDTTSEAVWARLLETGFTAEQILKATGAVIAGKVSGAGTNTETFRSIADDRDAIISTVDSNGNRLDIVTDV